MDALIPARPASRPLGYAEWLLLLGLGVASGVAILAWDAWGMLIVLTTLVMGVAVWYGVSNPGVLLILCTILFSTSGALRNLGSFEVRGADLSVSGVATAFVLGAGGLTLLVNLKLLRGAWGRSILPFWLVAIIAAVRAVGSQDVIEGLRDTVLIGTPCVLALLTRLAIHIEPAVRDRIVRVLLWSPILGAVAIVGGLLTDVAEFSDIGVKGIPGRSMSLFLIVVLGLSLACWRNGDARTRRRRGLWGTIVSLGIIVGTLSRMATVVAVAVQLPMGIARLDRKWGLKVVAACLTGVGVLAILMQWPIMRQRFLGSQNVPLYAVGELTDAIPMTGRDKAWSLVWSDAIAHPLIGHGPGTSRVLVNSTYASLEHPHNEYLRVFHDLGLLGLVPFLWGWLGRIAHHWRRWRTRRSEVGEAVVWHKAATLSALGVALTFLTDNALLHVFVTGPLFMIFALADATDTP